MKKVARHIAVILVLSLMILSFQNCSQFSKDGSPTPGEVGNQDPFASIASYYFPPADQSTNEASGSWETTTPESAGFTTTGINDLIQFLQTPLPNSKYPDVCGTGTAGLMILYKGKSVLEWYNPKWGANWNTCRLYYIDQSLPHAGPMTATTSGDIYSSTKSIISALVGIFIDSGKIKSLDDPVSNYLGDDWTCIAKEMNGGSPKYTLSRARELEKAVTIRNILNMTSGVGGTGKGGTGVYPYYVTEPGTVWFYNTNLYHQMINILQAADGGHPPKPDCSLAKDSYEETVSDITPLAKKYLFDKIGMNHTFFRNAMSDPKENYKSVYSSLRDMARFGHLMLSRGKWKNTSGTLETILNSQNGYYGKSISTYDLSPHQVKDSFYQNDSYGYLWWLPAKDSALVTGIDYQACYIYKKDGVNIGLGTNPSGELPADLSDCDKKMTTLIPSAPKDIFAALGGLDKKIYVVPSLDLVIVRYGTTASGTSLAAGEFDEYLWQQIMKAR